MPALTPDTSLVPFEGGLERTLRGEDLVRLYEVRAREVPDAQEAGHLLSRAGALARERLKNPQRAEELFQRALAYAPREREALTGLADLFALRQEYVGLVDVLEMLGQVSSGSDAASLYAQAAALCEVRLKRRDRAVLLLHMAVRASPREPAYYREARRLLLAEGRWRSAFDVLELEREALGTREAEDAYLGLAEALVDQPDQHGLAKQAVERVLETDAESARARAVLSAIEGLGASWRDRAKQLMARSLEERDRRAAAWMTLKVAGLFAHYAPAEGEKVTEALDRAFALWPAMPRALDFIEQRGQGDVKRALQALSRVGERASEVGARVDVLLRAGQLLLTKLNNRAEAARVISQAARLDPARADAAALASEVLVDSGCFADAVALLERHSEHLKDRRALLGLRLHLADLAERGLKDAALAQKHLRAAHELEPHNPQVVYRLAQVLVARGDLEGVWPLLELAVSAPQPVVERALFCEAVAAMCERAGDAKRAAVALAFALPLVPDRPGLVEACQNAAARAGTLADLANTLKRVAAAAPGHARGPLWKVAGKVLLAQGRLAEAREAVGFALALLPDDTELEADLTTVELGLGGEVKDPRSRLEAEARKLESTGSEPETLAELYRAILLLDPQSVPTLKKLASLSEAEGEWAELAVVAERLLALAVSSDERRGWRERLAQVCAERLDRRSEAVGLYLTMLGDGGPNGAVIAGLERLASLGVRRAEIARALAPVYAQSGDFQRQVASLLVQLSTTERPEDQLQLLALLAETSETRLLDERAAFDFRLRGLTQAPDHAAFRHEAVRLCRQVKAQSEMARFLVELSARLEGEGPATSMLEDAAELAEEAHAVDEAIAAYRAAIERAPRRKDLVASLARLLADANRLSEREEVLRRLSGLEVGGEKRRVLLAIAELDERLDRPGEAAQALSEASALAVPTPDDLKKEADLWERAGRPRELAMALQRLLEAAERAGDVALAASTRTRRGALAVGASGDSGANVAAHFETLSREPSNAVALAALEAMLSDERQRLEAARALARAAAAAREPRRQVAALGVVADAAPDTYERITALREVARLHGEMLRQPEQAFAALARAMNLAPDDEELRAAARQAAENADALDTYAELLEELVADEGTTSSAALHQELADVYEQKLADQVGAVKHRNAVLGLEPKNVEALKGLQRIHRASEAWAGLLDVTERLAEQELDPVARTALEREAALISEQRLEDPERAAVHWRQIAARDVRARDAAAALDRLATALDRPDELAFALELRRNQEGSSAQGRELALRLAELRASKLGDPDGAVDLYRQILAEDPAHEGALAALEALARTDAVWAASALAVLDSALAKLGEHRRRLQLREQRLADHRSGADAARLAAEVRVILERDLGQPAAAFIHAIKSFTDGLDRGAVQPDLERLAQVTGSYDELAEIYETTAEELAENEPQGWALLRRAAELREQLNQPDEAVADLEALLKRNPKDRSALASLSALLERSQNARNLSEVYAQQAAMATQPNDRLQLLLKAADAWEASGDDEHAIVALQQALAVERTTEVLAALERLLAKTHRYGEEAEILGELASLAKDPESKRGALLRQAALYEKDASFESALRVFTEVYALSRATGGPGGEEAAEFPAQLVSGLERLVAVEATRAEAARLLEKICRAGGDLKRLAEVLEARLEEARGGRRVALWLEAATLREAVGQRALALALRLRAFAEVPDDDEVREELDRLGTQLGAYEELAEAYRAAVESPLGEPLLGELWRRLAVLYGEHLERPDLAILAGKQALLLRPHDRAIIDLLARTYRRTSQFRDLAGAMRDQIELESSVEGQIALLFELAGLAEDLLSDRALALECYQSILGRRSDDLTAVRCLERLYASLEQWSALAEALGRDLDIVTRRGEEEVALDLMVRLGRLKLTRLGDPRGALSTYQEVLKRRPGHAGAIGALEEMAQSENPLKGEAASTVEPEFANEGDYFKQVQMLETRVASAAKPADRAVILRKMTELYARQMDNPEMAFVTAARALREVPEDRPSLALVLQLCAKADASDEATALLAEVALRAADDGSRGELYRGLARLQSQANEVAHAIESWKRVLELSPTDGEAMEQLGRLLEGQGRLPELVDTLKRQLTVEEDPDRRAALLLRLGLVEQEQLKDPMAATATFRRLLELRPEDPEGLARLERLCEVQQRWPEVADLAARRLKRATGDERVELMLRLATVREARLLDKAGAVELYAEILEQHPGHPGALARLEPMVQREPQNQGAVVALLNAYRRSGETAKLPKVLEARVGVSPDGVERKQLLQDLASVREAQGEPELAYLALFRAFKEDPNDAALRKRMEADAAAAGSWEELAGAYEGELSRIVEPAEAAQVCLTLAGVYEQRLAEPEQAVLFYERAMKQQPEASARALAALDRLYAQLDQPQRQSEVLESLAALQADPADQVALNFRLGQLAMERLDSPDRAATAFERVLRADPKHLPTLRSLEAIYEQAKASKKLYGVLESQRELVSGPERDRVLARMASVSAEGLDNATHSIALYRELLAKNPRNEQAFEALTTLLDREGLAEELRELLTARLQVTVDPRDLVRINERLGRVLYSQLDRPEDAVPHFKAALERDARNRGALEALRDIYDRLGRRDELVVVLRRLVPLQEDASGVKQVRLRLAEILSQTGRREETLDAARRVLEVEPHTIKELERVYAVFAQLKAWPDAVRALELGSQVYIAGGDMDRGVEALFNVADLWRGVAARPDAAGQALQKILEVDRSNRKAYDQALELFSKLSDWRSYAQVMERFLLTLVTDEEKVASLRQLARVQEQKLGQKDVAFLQYCRALPMAAADDSLRQEVERLAEETGSAEELAAVYEEVADELPRGPLAERMYLTLARVHDEKLDDPAAAEASLRKILDFDPTNEPALDRLGKMFARRGRTRELIVALEQKVEAADSIERRKEILQEIAKTWSETLNNPAEAEVALQRSLELEPDLPTFEALVALQRRQHNHVAVTHSLLRMRDHAPSLEDRARIQLEVALLQEREILDDEAAVEAYRQALEYDPNNAAALSSLERLYSKLDRPAELLGVYERQIETTQDYRERVRILFKSASIWEERFQNLANADSCIEAALQVEPHSLQAIKALERLRRAQFRWEDLIGVLERHAQLLTDPSEQAELYVELGDVFHHQLKVVDRAVNAYHQAIELYPRCRPAVHELGMLYERSGNWPFALEMLQREAEVVGQSSDAVDLHFRTGKISEDMLMDPESAKRAYLAALSIDQAYLPAIRSLKGIYLLERDDANFEKMLNEEARQTEDHQERATAFLEVARYYESKENNEAAGQAYEEAIRLTPDSLEAARPLADIYLARESWAECEKMLDIVLAHLSRKYAQNQEDPDLAKELCRRFYRLGYVCEKLAQRDKALNAYEKAYQLDPTYLAVLEGYGHLLVEAQRHEEAQRVYQSILVHHRSDLTDLEVAEIYWTLGELHVHQKQTDRAENHFEKALGIDPMHDPTLRSMVALTESQGRWDKAVEYRQKLINVVSGDEKFEVASALGKLAREKLNDPYVAIEAYLSASRERPDALDVLDALYVLYRETKQGSKAAEALEKMLATEQLRADAARARRVWFALGEIARDELLDLEKAASAFNAALDLDWRFIEAFAALESMLGRNKKWKTLDENYKRMLSRVPKTDETHAARMSLWRALGDLYLNVLQAPEAAVEVYKVVATGLPNDVEIQEQFAALAGTQPGHEQEAVDAWRRALPQTSNPGKVSSALAELAAHRKDYDSAWLAAQISAALIGELGQGEREILTKLTPYARKREVAQRQLTDRLWQQHLFHPKVRGPLGEIFALLFEQAGGNYKEDFSRFNINPKRHLIDVAGAQEYQLHHYRYVARLFGMDQVALFSPFLVATRERMAKRSTELAPDPMVGVEILHTDPVALKVGGKFFGETGQKEVYYLLGRAMAMLRPELILTVRLSAERLEALLQAAISFGVERFRFSADPRAIDAERRLLERALTEQAKGALVRIVREYVKVATTADLTHYLEGAELSATRAGAFVAGDIEPVKKMVLAETGSMYRVQPRSKVRDLMVFALGEDLHALRVAVGTNVEVALRK